MKRLIKRILLLLLLLVVVGYGIFALFFFSRLSCPEKCGEIVVKLMNEEKSQLISQAQIRSVITGSPLNPIGKPISEINTEAIEDLLEKNKIIKNAVVYRTNSEKIIVKIYQRIPLYKIMGENGNFLVDTEGVIMPLRNILAAKLPIVSAKLETIEKEGVTNELRDFVVYLQQHEFWNEQIEQIYVFENREVELIPKVGRHRILMGTLTDVDKKLNRLMKFYQKGLNEVGWNRYSEINLKYDKQVVCTKR